MRKSSDIPEIESKNIQSGFSTLSFCNKSEYKAKGIKKTPAPLLKDYDQLQSLHLEKTDTFSKVTEPSKVSTCLMQRFFCYP